MAGFTRECQARASLLEPPFLQVPVTEDQPVSGAEFSDDRKADGRKAETAGLDPAGLDIERLVEENLGWLRGWVRGRVNDPDLAHDIVQESLLKALRSRSRLKDPTRFPAWVYRIAQNTLRDFLRRKKRRQRRLRLTDQLDHFEDATSDDRSPEGLEEVESILEKIRALPSRYREPLLLRHAEDLSYAEIGKILRITENAVQVRIFRARKMLREKLRDQGVWQESPRKTGGTP